MDINNSYNTCDNKNDTSSDITNSDTAELTHKDTVARLNIPELVRFEKYPRYISLIKSYEDTLQKVFTTIEKSHITQNPLVFLWSISKEDNDDLFEKINMFDCEILNNIIKNKNNLVMCGPYIRSFIIGKNSSKNIRKELYLYKYTQDKWSTFVDIDIFEEKKTEFVYVSENIKIFLIKKTYVSPSHILLQHNYLKRVCWLNDTFYVSSMFLIEYQKHKALIKSDFKDPILKTPYDPLDIYTSDEHDITHPIRIIDLVDCDAFLELSKKNYTKLFNGKTCIELCMDKYVKETHPILQDELKKLILFLSGITYKRSPIMYAHCLNMHVVYPDLYDIIKFIPNEYELNNELLIGIIDKQKKSDISIENINILVMYQIIATDNVENFFDYIKYIKKKIDKHIIHEICNSEANKIGKFIMENNIISNESEHLMYYMIFMLENLDLIKYLPTDFKIDIALNYLKDIVEHGKIRSFYFLYELDNSILNTVFDNNKNLLHYIKNGKYTDMIHIIMKLKPELINLIDTNNETCIMHHSKHNPHIIEIFLSYTFDPTIFDKDNNTFLHHLCKQDNINILRSAITKYPELIDMPNKYSETPIIVSTKYSKENNFYILKGKGADLLTKDQYGNTCYHYICANSLCLGITIENIPNLFGMTPKNYCKISTKYYHFR